MVWLVVRKWQEALHHLLLIDSFHEYSSSSLLIKNEGKKTLMLVMAGKEVDEADSIMLKELEQACISSHHNTRARGLCLSYSAHISCVSCYLCVEFYSHFPIKWFTGVGSMVG